MPPLSNGGKEVRPSCVKVYLNAFAQDDKISIKKKVSRKIILRVASQNSLRSNTRYLPTMAASNFIQGKISQDHLSNTKLGTMDHKNWSV